MSKDELQIYTCEQGSYEWLTARLGIPTASQFGAALSRGPKGGVSKTRRTYMLKLVGELLTGRPAENFNNVHMERGKGMEAEALAAYEIQSGNWPDKVGFIRRGRVGASPDALVDLKGLVEIKTKLPHLQLEVLLDGQLPADHKAQVQGQLWVAEREWSDFVSYWPGLPLVVVRVHRDEAFIATLQMEVASFLGEMDEMLAAFAKMGALPRPPLTQTELAALRIDPKSEFDNLEA